MVYGYGARTEEAVMEGLHVELRRLHMKPAPMPVSPREAVEPAPTPAAVKVVKVFNSGSAEERKFAENMAVIATAYHNGLITEAKAQELAARL